MRSVEFHPNGQLLLAAGLDKRVRFFSIDGLRNPSVQSVYFPDMPVHQAAFAAGGTQARHCRRCRRPASSLQCQTARALPPGCSDAIRRLPCARAGAVMSTQR